MTHVFTIVSLCALVGIANARIGEQREQHTLKMAVREEIVCNREMYTNQCKLLTENDCDKAYTDQTIFSYTRYYPCEFVAKKEDDVGTCKHGSKTKCRIFDTADTGEIELRAVGQEKDVVFFKSSGEYRTQVEESGITGRIMSECPGSDTSSGCKHYISTDGKKTDFYLTSQPQASRPQPPPPPGVAQCASGFQHIHMDDKKWFCYQRGSQLLGEGSFGAVYPAKLYVPSEEEPVPKEYAYTVKVITQTGPTVEKDIAQETMVNDMVCPYDEDGSRKCKPHITEYVGAAAGKLMFFKKYPMKASAYMMDVYDSNESKEVKKKRIRKVLEQLLKGLQEMHLLNLVHHDFKPSNALVDNSNPDEPRAVVAELGGAFVVEKVPADPPLFGEYYEADTKKNKIEHPFAFTPEFAPPEHWASSAQLCSPLGAFDLFSWAATKTFFYDGKFYPERNNNGIKDEEGNFFGKFMSRGKTKRGKTNWPRWYWSKDQIDGRKVKKWRAGKTTLPFNFLCKHEDFDETKITWD